MNKKNDKKGFSLVELAIGLAVITILILAISASAGIRDNARVQAAANSIETLRSAAENYIVSTGEMDYSSLTVAALQANNLLSANFDATKSNPWGGSFSVAPNAANSTHFDIALGGLNQAAGDKLISYFKNHAYSTPTYDPKKTTWIATF